MNIAYFKGFSSGQLSTLSNNLRLLAMSALILTLTSAGQARVNPKTQMRTKAITEKQSLKRETTKETSDAKAQTKAAQIRRHEFRLSQKLKPRTRYFAPIASNQSTPVSMTSTGKASTDANESKIISGGLVIGRGSTPKPENPEISNARLENTSYLGYLVAKISDKWLAVTEFGYVQNLNQPKKSGWADTPVLISYTGFEPAPALSMTTSLMGVAPTSNASKNRSLQYAAGGELKFGIKPAYMPLTDKWKLSVGANLLKNVVSNKESETGEFYNSWTSRQFISLDYADEVFFASAIFYHRNAIDFENTLKETYLHREMIGVKFLKRFSAALAHDFGGPAFQENGQSNYFFYSTESSYYSVLLGVSF